MTIRNSVYLEVLERVEPDILLPVDALVSTCSRDFIYQRIFRGIEPATSIAVYYPYVLCICPFASEVIKKL